MKEINKSELDDAVDLSIPQIVREPIIRLADKNWGRFLAKFSGNEATLRKRVDPEYIKVRRARNLVLLALNTVTRTTGVMQRRVEHRGP